MLILARKLGEKIMIGDEIEITVVDIQRGKIRLGITAPRTTEVHRQEIYNAIKRSLKGSSYAEAAESLKEQAATTESSAAIPVEGTGD